MIGRSFNIIREPIVLLQAQAALNGPYSRCSAYTRYKNAKKVVSTYPELAPAACFIPHWAQESQIFEEFTSAYDPLKSELLAFGDVPVIAQATSGTETVPVAAVVGGSGGDTVRFVRMNRERLSWREHTKAHSELTTFQEGIKSFWKGHDGPIQQLCFAQGTEDKRTWLAVRYHATIAVLQLLVTHKGALVSPGLQLCQRLDHYSEPRSPGNVLMILPIQRTGGYPQADVSFDPWNSRQFAVVDQKGHWSIWTLESRSQRTNLWEATRVASGHLRDGLTEDEEPLDLVDDGWGRIIWLGNPSTVLVASRTLLAAFSIDRPPRRLNVPGLGLAHTGDWILDLKRRPSEHDQAFVLTSTRILWLRSYLWEDQEISNTDTDVQILLSWKHFRDPNDLSLKFSIVNDSDGRSALSFHNRTLLKST